MNGSCDGIVCGKKYKVHLLHRLFQIVQLVRCITVLDMVGTPRNFDIIMTDKDVVLIKKAQIFTIFESLMR